MQLFKTRAYQVMEIDRLATEGKSKTLAVFTTKAEAEEYTTKAQKRNPTRQYWTYAMLTWSSDAGERVWEHMLAHPPNEACLVRLEGTSNTNEVMCNQSGEIFQLR